MPYYEWRGDGVFRDSRNDRQIENGDVVELPESVVGNHDFVEVDEPDDSDDNPKGSTDEDGDEVTCADENCSRKVDEEGEKCWQHSDDD